MLKMVMIGYKLQLIIQILVSQLLKRSAHKIRSLSGLVNKRRLTCLDNILWGDTEGKRIVLTEGEIDCLTIAQVFGLKWPVCSLTDGAQSAVRNIKENYEFLNKYSEIVLFFDSDPVGREAAKDAAQHLPAGKVKIANLSNYKDANGHL